jgi:uncharacterized protein
MLTDTSAPLAAEQPPRPFPSVWTGLLWVIIFFAIQLVVGGIATIGYAISSGSLQQAAENAGTVGDLKTLAVPLIWGLAASGVMTVFALAVFLKNKGRGAVIGLDNWTQIPVVRTIGTIIAVMAAAYAFNEMYTRFVIPGFDPQIDTTEIINAVPKTPLNWVLLFAAISILPGITEELVFRGLLQKSFSYHMPAYGAIALSAAMFAALHMQLAAFPMLMALGAAFGYIYHKTGSLRINIALHVFNNAAALLLSQLA